MTAPDPALDGPDAMRALRDAMEQELPFPIGARRPEAVIHALNEAGVVLCDEAALDALREELRTAERTVDDLRCEIDGCGCPAPYDTCPHSEPWVLRLAKAEAEVQRLAAERSDWMQVARVGRGNERYVRLTPDYTPSQRLLAAEAFGIDLDSPGHTPARPDAADMALVGLDLPTVETQRECAPEECTTLPSPRCCVWHES